jgi:hypothetical protein
VRGDHQQGQVLCLLGFDPVLADNFSIRHVLYLHQVLMLSTFQPAKSRRFTFVRCYCCNAGLWVVTVKASTLFGCLDVQVSRCQGDTGRRGRDAHSVSAVE